MSMLIRFLCLLIRPHFGLGDLIPKHSALEALLSRKGVSGGDFDTQGRGVYLILSLSFIYREPNSSGTSGNSLIDSQVSFAGNPVSFVARK